jgi:hypothetical protein
MLPRQLPLRGGLVLIFLICALLMAVPSRVSATTGPSIPLAPPQFKVALPVAHQFTGVYKMTSVAPAARIYACALGVEVNNRGYLFGYAQFYGYDITGHETLWLNVIYNFHQMPKSVMSIDLLGMGGSPLLGKMLLTRTKQGNLTGKILLPLGTWPITFKKVKSDWSPAQA